MSFATRGKGSMFISLYSVLVSRYKNINDQIDCHKFLILFNPRCLLTKATPTLHGSEATYLMCILLTLLNRKAL